MYKNNNNHHNLPNTPPLSISLPPITRHEPDPKPKLKPTPIPIPKPKPKPKPNPVRVSSPTRSESPHQNDTALVAVVEKYYSPLTSPLPATPPKDNSQIPVLPPPHHVINLSQHGEVPPQSGVVLGDGGGERKVRSGGSGGVKKEVVAVKVGLLLRVLEIVLCLISFSVMASDKTQGWSGDSFDRYTEYRFCLTVAIFGFVYSAFQAYDLGSHLATGKHVITHRFRYQFVFLMDQIIAYLLISASSASASRVDNWQANWGKDEVTQKASASISMAFLAFFCFATSSLISGYNLCNRDLY